MAKPYLVMFDDATTTRGAVTKFLDGVPQVTYWYATFSASVFLTSSLTAEELYEKAAESLGAELRIAFFVLDTKNSQGLMTKQLWHLINNPDNPRFRK